MSAHNKNFIALKIYTVSKRPTQEQLHKLTIPRLMIKRNLANTNSVKTFCIHKWFEQLTDKVGGNSDHSGSRDRRSGQP